MRFVEMDQTLDLTEVSEVYNSDLDGAGSDGDDDKEPTTTVSEKEIQDDYEKRIRNQRKKTKATVHPH